MGSPLAPWPALADQPPVNRLITVLALALCKECRKDVERHHGFLPLALSGYPMPPSVKDTSGRVVFPYHVVRTGEALVEGVGRVKAVEQVKKCWSSQLWLAIETARERGVL